MKRRFFLGDRLLLLLSTTAALLVLLLIAGIFVVLVGHSRLAFQHLGLRFFVQHIWNPVTGEFGALPSLYGTLVTTLIALVLAVPLSLAVALLLAELAPPWLATPVSLAVELLAAIPSIIYGMWGLYVFAPYMAHHVEPWLQRTLGFLPLFQGPTHGIGFLTAGIILALMILPFMSAVMREVFQMVPAVVKEAGYGIGATTWEVTRGVILRYGIRGLLGAVFLGLGRALGETMAVTFVIGNEHRLSLSLFSPGTSITSTLANEFTEASEPVYLSALIELGLLLFLVSLVIQVLALLWLKRMERRMGAGP